MWWNRRFKAIEESLEFRKEADTRLSDRIHVLQGQVDRLREYLNVQEHHVSKIYLEKKGGPEKEPL